MRAGIPTSKIRILVSYLDPAKCNKPKLCKVCKDFLPFEIFIFVKFNKEKIFRHETCRYVTKNRCAQLLNGIFTIEFLLVPIK